MDNYGFYRDGKSGAPRRGMFSYLLVGVVGALTGGMLVLTFAPAALLGRALLPEDTKQSDYPETEQMVIMPERVETALATVVAKNITPAVVGIRTIKYGNSTPPEKTKGVFERSGVIVDKKGYILTSNYPADGADSGITVYLSDGRSMPANIVWTDEVLGLSIMKIEADGLVAAELCNSDNIEVGEMAITMGNPLGLSFQRHVTKGIVSAVNSTVPVDKDKFMEGLIVTDAYINGDNGGGPLVNSDGKVIGINTKRVKDYEGMGFAIPVNNAAPAIKSLVEAGKFKPPYIGITGLNKETAGLLGYNIDKGVFIEDIERNSPFYNAGIRRGDIILEINDNEVDSFVQLSQSIFNLGEWSSVKIKYRDRSGNVKTVIAEIEPVSEQQQIQGSRGDEH